MSEYDQGVDYKFLDAMGIRVVHHQPWQLGLFQEELEGKFVWYPRKGTLMYESDNYSSKIGESGDYKGSDPESTENVYLKIMDKVREQQSNG